MINLQTIDDELGARVRIERERLNMTQADLAAMIDSSSGMVGLYERNKHRCPAVLLEALALKGADSTYLLTGVRPIDRTTTEHVAAAGLAVLKTLPSMKANEQLAQALQTIELAFDTNVNDGQLTEEESKLLNAFRSANAKQREALLTVIAMMGC